MYHYGKKISPIINWETLEIFTKNQEKNQPSIIYIYICRIFIVFFFGNIQLFLKFLLFKPFPPPPLYNCSILVHNSNSDPRS